MLNQEVSDTWGDQVHAIALVSETTDTEIEDLQGQLGSDLVQILGHVLARPVPEECELGQSIWEYKSLASLISKMRLHHAILRVKMLKKNREMEVVVCQQPLRVMIIRTLRRVQLGWYWPAMSSDLRQLIYTYKVCQLANLCTTASSGHRQRLFAGRPW